MSALTHPLSVADGRLWLGRHRWPAGAASR